MNSKVMRDRQFKAQYGASEAVPMKRDVNPTKDEKQRMSEWLEKRGLSRRWNGRPRVKKP